MKDLKKHMLASLVVVAVATLTLALTAADGKTDKDAKSKAYPLKTCLVSGEKLDSMGEPYVFKHEGREVKLCCKSCLKDFNKEAAKFIKKLDDAEKKPAK
jgi:hypothetical protein